MDGVYKLQRKRQSAPKVRSGCLTCKIRRVKCDETRPKCTRCIKFCVTCDGYADKNAPMKFIPVRPLAISIPPIPPGGLNLGEQEMRYFQDFVQDRFIDNRRKDLSSSRRFLVTDTFFWAGIVLQECHATPCTRHAIVAIGALVRSLHDHWQGDMNPPDTVDPHHEFALLQYHKSIRNLRNAILVPDNYNSPRVALVACIVLASFDMLYGHKSFATQHMEYGRRIISHWRKKNRDLGLQLDPAPQSIDNISRLFLRLDLQATYLTGGNPTDTYEDLDIGKLPMEMPAQFASMDEARYIGHLLISRSGNFRLKYMHLEYSQDPIPPEIEERREYFLQQFHLYRKASIRRIEHLSAKNWTQVHPLARPQSMMIYTAAMWMRLTPGWGRPQTACDALEPQFEYIISMARNIIEYERETNKDAAIICFEYRILPFLFLTATKCRKSALRREAIDLMASTQWREGIWDSILGAKMATWIVEMEEAGMVDGFVPESARCFGETFSVEIPKRVATVRCWQNMVGGGCVERETTLKW